MVSIEARRAIDQLRARPPFGADGFDLSLLRQIMSAPRPPADREVRCEAWQSEGLTGQWVLAAGADPQVRLLYLHGGGFVSGSAAYYLAFAALLSAECGCAVALPDYRLAPEHPFPHGLEDCVGAYEWLRRFGPDGQSPAKAVFVGGDSAGGGLALAALLALRGRNRPLPAGAVAISPFADLTLAGGSLRAEADLDPVQHPSSLPEYVSRYLAGGAAIDARAPLVSPVFGDYGGLPPLLVQVGEHEIIRDDSVRVAAKANADGARATLEIWPGMFHVFQAHDPPLPESRRAIRHIGRFLRLLAT